MPTLTPQRMVLASHDRYYRSQIAESMKPARSRVKVPMPGDAWTPIIGSTELDLKDGWKWERARTRLALLEVALAVRGHHLEHGQYPAHLADIAGKWLPQIPVDLWDQPMAYRLRNGKPVIYSLGPDGRDDGGQAADPVTLNPSTRGDLVFGKLMRLERTRHGTRR